MTATNSNGPGNGDPSNAELVAVMRELIDTIGRQTAMDAARVSAAAPVLPASDPGRPTNHAGHCECQQRPSSQCPPQCGPDTVTMQYGHSAARYNEAMSQITADKQLQYISQTADRWQLMFRQLNGVSQ